MAGNNIYVQGSYIDVHDNENVYLSVDKAQVHMGKERGVQQMTLQMMKACVGRVRSHFWSESAMAVVFCVCRDYFGYPNNMSQFERDFDCAEGLLSNTFRNNTYMRLHVDKWSQGNVKDRVLRLVEAYRKAVEEELAG